MPAKASAGTEVIPLLSRFSLPPCVGQEPDRTSGAPLESPLKLQPPNPTVHGKAEALLDAARRPSSTGNIFLDTDMLSKTHTVQSAMKHRDFYFTTDEFYFTTDYLNEFYFTTDEKRKTPTPPGHQTQYS